MTDIALQPARKLAAMIRAKKIGCAELLDHYLARVEKYNPALNAVIAFDIDNAKKQARAADRVIARGMTLGPFHGVPMTVKDAFDVKGLPTTWGFPTLRDHKAEGDALAVTRWRQAGAVVFGKTNVPARLADWQSFNDIYGTTNNPWNTAYTCGGSSGGAAAAVAAGLCGLEVGSDIASSIRSPAIYCGIYGHKPTYGLCPTRGHAVRGRLSPDDINVVGPLTRSAGDLDLALSVMAGPDEIDGKGYRLALKPPANKAFKGLRIAVMANHPTSEVDDEVQAALQGLATFLRKNGARIDEKARPAIDMHRVHQLANMMVRAALSYHQTDTDFTASLDGVAALADEDDTFAARALRGVAATHRDWLGFHEERHKLRWAWHTFFKDFDLLLCPLAPTTAFPHDHTPIAQRRITINGQSKPFAEMMFWAGLVGLPYLPATAIPIGLSKAGLPIGIQVVAPHYGDLASIHFAKLAEKAFYAYRPPPDFL